MEQLRTNKRDYGLYLQSAWNSAISVTETDYQKFFIDSGSGFFTKDVMVDNFDFSSQAGLMPQKNRTNVDVTTGLGGFNFTKKFDMSTDAAFLAAAFHSVTEASTTPFGKTITHINDNVEWTNDEGYVFTLATYNSNSSVGTQILSNAIMNTLGLSYDSRSTSLDRPLMMNGEMLGKYADNNSFTSSGFTGSFSTSNLLHNNFTLVFDIGSISVTSDTDFLWYTFNMTVNNNVSALGLTSGGVPASWRWNPQITFEILLPVNENTEAIYNDYVDGDVGNISFYNGNGADSKTINITTPTDYVHYTACERTNEGGYEAFRITGRLETDSNGSPGSTLLKFADAVDWGF